MNKIYECCEKSFTPLLIVRTSDIAKSVRVRRPERIAGRR